MPKSYLANEPGAQRALHHAFNPYDQTYQRLLTFHQIGHDVSKVELIILGGTWSVYPEPYQIWFIKECFRAINDFGEKEITGAQLSADKKSQAIVDEKLSVSTTESADWSELFAQQKRNETARCRNVGLVIETRPDRISEYEVTKIRKFGCTKTQIGIQSLRDEVLEKNKRGHDVAATKKAFRLLRQAGFKIHAHWMPNLYGSTPEQDKKEYELLFSDPDFKPDELKIYPCSLIAGTELMNKYKDGSWKPYTEAELIDVLTFCLLHTPEYCRITRVMRDIPSTDIVAGNLKTNIREMAEKKLAAISTQSKDIRAREIKQQQVKRTDLKLETVDYITAVSNENFLQFVTKEHQIAGFLRLSLPTKKNFLPDLENAAIIREVHVYGSALALGTKEAGKAQHLGLGSELISEAKKIAAKNGYEKLAVISAVGTREYYRQRGFIDGELYQIFSLSD